MLAQTVASIPSPSDGQFSIGGLRITMYGILIGIGIIVAVVVVTRRFRNYGGDPRIVERVALWAVIAGLIGARLAWVTTHTGELDSVLDVFAVWQGGLAFYGGILFGAITAIVLVVRMDADVRMLADATAVGIPLAQAIGRWGNYFNQELYGRPTDLPWGLEIDVFHRVGGFETFETFHPTFLYESLWNLVIAGALVLIDKQRVIKRGNLFLLYLMMVSFGRFFWEQLRLDTTFRVFGVSRNGWVSVAVFIGATIWFALRQRDPEILTWEGVEPWTDVTEASGESPEAKPAGEDDESEVTGQSGDSDEKSSV